MDAPAKMRPRACRSVRKRSTGCFEDLAYLEEDLRIVEREADDDLTQALAEGDDFAPNILSAEQGFSIAEQIRLTEAIQSMRLFLYTRQCARGCDVVRLSLPPQDLAELMKVFDAAAKKLVAFLEKTTTMLRDEMQPFEWRSVRLDPNARRLRLATSLASLSAACMLLRLRHRKTSKN